MYKNILLEKYNKRGGLCPLHQTITLLFGINGYTENAKRIITKYGNERINSIKVYRTPLSSGLKFVLNAVSLGEFEKKVKELGYDKLYHLSAVIDTTKGRILIEKCDVITLKERPTVAGENIDISIGNKTISVYKLLNKTMKKMKTYYFSYNATENNCADFILGILTANGLNNSSNQSFIKQNVNGLFDERTRKIVNTTTEVGGRVNTAINQPPSSKDGHFLNKTGIIPQQHEPVEHPEEETN
jgi:hypothetical protein